MPDVLMYADTFRSPELRHEVPLGVPDPFLYVEQDGVKHIVDRLDGDPAPRGARAVRAAPVRGVRARRPDRRRACPTPRSSTRSPLRAVTALGVTKAVVPGGVPALARRPAARRRRRADRRRRVLRRPPPREDASRARRHPPRAARRRGRDGRRARPAAPRAEQNGDRPRARRRAADRRAGQGRDGAGVRRARRARPTTSSSRRARRGRSATTWAPGRSRPACRS